MISSSTWQEDEKTGQQWTVAIGLRVRQTKYFELRMFETDCRHYFDSRAQTKCLIAPSYVFLLTDVCCRIFGSLWVRWIEWMIFYALCRPPNFFGKLNIVAVAVVYSNICSNLAPESQYWRLLLPPLCFAYKAYVTGRQYQILSVEAGVPHTEPL